MDLIGQALKSPTELEMGEIDAFLHQFQHFGVRLGLERIQGLLADLGNPHQCIPVIHVAGTNGKGSVCAYLSAALTHAGYRVGRYTSPHLISWCERITLNEQPILPQELLRSLHTIQTTLRSDQPSPTQFEVITAAAWLYFAEQQVDIAIMEVGLGGRLDATNVCEQPLVTVITSISRDHCQTLGDTLGAIAAEKAGILKPGRPAVVGPLPPEALEVIQARIAALGCPAIWVEPAIALAGGWAEFQGISYFLALQGAVQLTNSALAIAALQQLQKQGWRLGDEAIAVGMGKAHWLGRLQWFEWQGTQILIDGAHNVAGAAALRQFVETQLLQGQVIHWVMGLIATKEHSDIFRALLRPGDALYLCPVPDHLSTDLDHLATLAASICPELSDCQTHPEVFAALASARTMPQDVPSPLVVLCGSLYLIGHFLGQVGKA